MTRDHSVVQQMLDANMITEEQALEHPDSNRITRALGMAPEVDVELRKGPLPIAAGDVFLLTSDGLTDLVSDQELLSVATNRGAEGLQAACQALVNTANMRGGHDNITVLMLKMAQKPCWIPRPPLHKSTLRRLRRSWKRVRLPSCPIRPRAPAPNPAYSRVPFTDPHPMRGTNSRASIRIVSAS
jgi:serine/threonine protein phosphatase PrpC